MLKIMVTTYNGQPPERPIEAEFGEFGGKIGRATDNTLVLPDVQRYISRMHAHVFFRAGLYVIKDVGSASPVFVNDWQLGTGQEAPIGDGDEIRIAGFSMRVVGDASKKAPDSPAVASTVATSLVDTSSVAASPTDRSPAATLPTDASAFAASPGDASVSAASPALRDDPLAAFGGGLSHSDPFADLIPPPQSPPAKELLARASMEPVVRPPPLERPSFAAPPAPPASSPSAIPDDFDPFADSTPAPPPEPPRLPDDLGLGGASTGESQNIDELFGLGSGSGSDPFKSDSPLAEALDSGHHSAPVDPLVAMGLARAVKTAPFMTQRDNTPEIYGSYRFPRATVDEPAEELQNDGDAGAPASAAVPEAANETPPSVAPPITDAVPSPTEWRAGAAPQPAPPGIDAVPTPTQLRAGAAPNAGPAGAQDASAAIGAGAAGEAAIVRVTLAPSVEPSRAGIGGTRTALREPPPAGGPATPATTDELLRAYLEGAGVPEVQVPGGLTPELMHVLGQMLRECTQGTIDLLHARTTAKRQLRAEMTMIVARENNPLKFSPTVEGAMTHLLAPQERGFMTPLRAVKDAYNDLRSHEVGFVAGMRAALAGILARFNPAELEKRLTSKSVLDSLLPMNRQAKLWSLFEERFADISAEADDNFQSLFGREFVRAYEQQIAKLEKEERTPRS